MDSKVTIGVPIYKGERYLEETLHSIQQQTYKSFDVVMSVDGPDPACEAICEKFLGDPRFRMIVQPERLGWVGNRNWLSARAENSFWYYHQQDDLTDATYLEVLVDHAQRHPSAALVYCDMWPFGRFDGPVFSMPPVFGVTPFTRVLTMLHEHFPAFAFRGLTRAAALRAAGPLLQNDVDNFGVDITWITAIARAGELHRIPLVLYKKRYHDRNTESRWWNISHDDRLRYWSRHCVDMLGQALAVKGSAEQARLLWSAAVARLTAPEAAGHFLELSEVDSDDRDDLLQSFLDTALSLYADRLLVWLDADRDAIIDWSKKSFWLPREEPITIKSYGPDCVDCGEPFNLQPDGGSGLWILANRRLPSKTVVCLDGRHLETVVNGDVATARVPMEAIAQPGERRLFLAGPDGRVRSNAVIFKVVDAVSYWALQKEPITIKSYGPAGINYGEPFNVQADGGSAIWILADRPLPPKTIVCLDGRRLETVLNGDVATARVPPESISRPGELRLLLAGPDGIARSNAVIFKVSAPRRKRRK